MLDHELVELYVDEYRLEIEQIIPDLSDSLDMDTYNPDYGMLHDTLVDCAADRICEGERSKGTPWIPEYRAAAEQIAKHYCG